MRVIEILFEANLSYRTFGERNPEYWVNLLNIISSNKSLWIQIGEQPPEKAQVEDGSKISSQMEKIWDGSDIATPDQIDQIKKFNIPLTNGNTIKVNNIFKSPAIKGKSADYNIGDIGEITLGISATARFQKAGGQISLDDFLAIARKLEISPVPKQRSMQGEWSGEIENDHHDLELYIALSTRSMVAFQKFLKDFDNIPNNVAGTIHSAIKWANENQNIVAALQKVAESDSRSTIKVSANGVGDQKGTKADLSLYIDGETFNLISAKAGASQLGQASGIDWNNIYKFFNVVFGVDINKYKKEWTTSNESNIKVLQKIYTNDVIPKVTRLTGGDNNKKEAELIKQVGNGLIHYANDVGNNGPKIIDIVKLMTTPTKPGYKLMRIDQNLVAALEHVDLVGQATPNNLGIAVYGTIDGRRMLLFRARSYYSPAARITRTIIEGGALLDYLATIDMQAPHTEST